MGKGRVFFESGFCVFSKLLLSRYGSSIVIVNDILSLDFMEFY